MSEDLSVHSSSDIVVKPLRLLGGSPHDSEDDSRMITAESTAFVTARSAVDLSVTSNGPFGPQEEHQDTSRNTQESNTQQTRLWSTVQNKALEAFRNAAVSAGHLLERMLEPPVGNGNPSQDVSSLQVVYTNGSNEPFDALNHITHLTLDDLPDEEEEEEEELETPRIEIDLVSTLQAYCKNPSDCFGHLVAAALSSRSKENPVTGDELREARLNPYLVRMIIDSRCLDLEDKTVHAEIQRCVDAVIPSESGRVSLSVYEYLPSLLKLNFVRLSPERYAVMKDSGFEFLKLLCEYPHVLPPGRLNSIRLNYVHSTCYFDFFTMILSMVLEIFCITGIILALIRWVALSGDNFDSVFGYYTALVYGIGYAAHLIGMIFLMRGKARNAVYGKMICAFPSPHLLVVPVVPLYNLVSIFTYVRYRKANRCGKYVVILHDIVAAQVLSSLCFVLCVAMPQFLYQSIVVFDNRKLYPISKEHFFKLLTASTILTFLVSILRMLRALATYDSINCFGFACFGYQRERIIEKHSAIVRMIHVLCFFLFELNVSFLVLGALSVSDCKTKSITTIAMAGASILILLVLFFLLLLSHESVFRLMWALLPLTPLQIALFVYQYCTLDGNCRFIIVRNGNVALFCFVMWVLFLFLALWAMQYFVVFLSRKLRSLSR
ncbi:hypothetical protein MOQ_004245 [Trypanosoma cruzi marinkellei]|uniref:Uncharacterized protein n=1 Tax=Trypanosoma cruzi marinkellei TaxID=85056 RepID=K2MXQ7_TRYCR|nr:hypothetical protein MOQ_004245 [Trypanosoma cruzi marinkellei]